MTQRRGTDVSLWQPLLIAFRVFCCLGYNSSRLGGTGQGGGGAYLVG